MLAPSGACDLQVVDEEKTKKKQEEADAAAKEKGDEQPAEKVTPETKSESKQVWDWVVQNDSKPLWTRSPKEVSPHLYERGASHACAAFPP